MSPARAKIRVSLTSRTGPLNMHIGCLLVWDRPNRCRTHEFLQTYREMDAALKTEFLTVQEYLDGEEISDIRHEYSAGRVFAMAGGTDDHNLIVGSLYSALRNHLRGGSCRVFMENVKLRMLLPEGDLFYYPDIMVTCDPRDTERQFKRFPKIVAEVLSEGTERVDRSEKYWRYVQLESVEEYVIVEQSRVEVTVFRRINNWQPEKSSLLTDYLRLKSVDFSVPLSAIYEHVQIPDA